jgi:hypothetical protein
MEQVINHLRLRTVLPDLQIERGVHIHGNRLNGGASFWTQPGEEGTESGSATPFSHSQYLLCIGVRQDSGVTVSFKQGKFIHHQATQTVSLRLTGLP